MLSQLNKLTDLLRAETIHRVDAPHRILFNHVPKCAGTTVTQYLKFHFPRRLVFQMNGRRAFESVERFRALPQRSRFRFRLIVGHSAHSLLDLVHPDTITVTLLRDPIDRIISHYFFVKHDKAHYLHERVVRSGITLEDYATSRLSDELENFYTTHFTGWTTAQVRKNPNEALAMAAETILGRYKIVGFQEDLAATAQRLRIAGNLRRPFTNFARKKSNDRAAPRDIPEVARKAIAETNSVDIQLFSLLRSRPVNDAVNARRSYETPQGNPALTG